MELLCYQIKSNQIKSNQIKSNQLIISAILLLSASVSHAFSITYTAPTDPLSEGWSFGGCCGSSKQGSAINDLGLSAWSISGGDIGSQFGYGLTTLSASQQDEIAMTGFTFTIVDRVERGQSPANDFNNIVIAGPLVDDGRRRWSIYLGLDNNGNTVLISPDSIDAGGPGGSIRAYGTSYIVNGNAYHTYQLVYNPTTQTADTYVDGVDVIKGYQGDTSFVSNAGWGFSGLSGGIANYHSVQLSSGMSPIAPTVPVPAAAWLFGTALAGFSLLRKGQAV